MPVIYGQSKAGIKHRSNMDGYVPPSTEPPMLKQCSRCERILPLSDFFYKSGIETGMCSARRRDTSRLRMAKASEARSCR